MKASKLLFVMASISVVAGCAQPTQSYWVKSGAGQAEWNTDRYACMQESQQRYSGATVNQFGGQSSSQMSTNPALFSACLNARGWYLSSSPSAQSSGSRSTSSRSPQISAADKANANLLTKRSESNERSIKWWRDTCRSSRFSRIYSNMPCFLHEINETHKTDTSKASEAASSQIRELLILKRDQDKRYASEIYLYYGNRGSALSKASLATDARVDAEFERLANREINWGQFNSTLSSLGAQHDEQVKTIMKTDY